MAIIGYARVSTHGQKLEAQLDALEKAGCEEIFQEKASGAKDDRPELANMLRFARKGDTVICTKLDRLARSTKHLLQIAEELEKKQVSLKVLNINLDTSTPTGKLMLTLLAAIGQFEREIMLERQREGFEQARKAGKIKGRPAKAQQQANTVIDMAARGTKREVIASELGIGVASVYRILREQQKKAQ